MIVGALLARNEAGPDRYLERVLKNMFTFCDEVVVLDDGSTDDTVSIAEQSGARVFRSSSKSAGFWGADETTPRAEIWRLASELAGSAGWIYVADADHELIDVTPDEIRECCRAEQVNAWCFPLLDCWQDDEHYRVDGYWQAHTNPRPWLFRALPFPGYIASWNTRGIHSGHCPANYPFYVGVAPGRIRHLGYVNPEHRERKAEQYLSLA